MLDVAALLYPAQYATWGKAATLTLTNLSAYDVTIIDKSEGLALENQSSAERQDVYTMTLVPAAFVRVSELIDAEVGADAAAVRAALRRAMLTIGARSWRIESSQPKPASTEEDGELILFLIEI